MSKTIYITESQLSNFKLKPFIYKAIANKRTSLGDNPALPPVGDFGFEYDVVKNRYATLEGKIADLISNGVIESSDTDYLLTELSKMTNRCIRLEKPLKPNLEKLCEKIVTEEFSIPDEVILLECKLVREVSTKNAFRIMPEGGEDDNGFSFEDVDEITTSNNAILKRRMVNALIQGASFIYSSIAMFKDYFDEISKMSDELIGLWNNILLLSDYLLYVKEEKISDKNPMQNSYVEVHLGKMGNKTKISSQGIIFPFLLKETFKGFFELFSAHGLPDDKEKAMYVIRQADFLAAEPWDMRIGIPMWNIIWKQMNGTELGKMNTIPYFFSDLCSLHTDEFNKVMKNLLSGTNFGKRYIQSKSDEIVHDIEYQKFSDRIQSKNKDLSLLSDDCFTSDELNNLNGGGEDEVLTEEDDDFFLEENMENELTAYHGSNANFDKFNHKKYMNRGAGSQTFGWGTYVTSDAIIGKSYTEISINVQDLDKNDLSKKIDEKFNCGLKAATEFVSYFYKMMNGYNVPFYYSIDKTVKGMECYGFKDSDLPMIDFILRYSISTNKREKILYKVEIPDDNGNNYLSWYDTPTRQQQQMIANGLRELEKRFNTKILKIYSFVEGKRAYETLQSAFEKYVGFKRNKGAKAASLFLMRCGFDGIKYPAGTIWKKPNGVSANAMNYVIFDANKVKIVNKEISSINSLGESREFESQTLIDENMENEMQGYHGSSADFNKFWHKKYLSTGAGSQSFGWGTYIADDRAIADGYVEASKANPAKDFMANVDIAPYLKSLNKYDDETIYEILKKFKSYVVSIFTDTFCVNPTFENAEQSLKDLIDFKRGELECYLPLDSVIKMYNGSDFDGMSEEEKQEKIKEHEELLREKERPIIIFNACLDALYHIKPQLDEYVKNKKSYLYEVEIPDDNGFNYLSWYDDLTNEQLNAIHSKIDEFSKRHGRINFHNFTEYSQRYSKPNGGNAVYDSLKFVFYKSGVDKRNSDKAASLFLMQCGFDGIKYPAGTRWQKPEGASDDAYNYVIFDANKVKIVDKKMV